MEKRSSDTPPVSGKWRNIYLLVIGMLVLMMVLFYFFTKHFE